MFNIKRMQFDPELHQYSIDGVPVYGVTSIFQATGVTPELDQDFMRFYAERGKRVHSVVELYKKKILQEDSVQPEDMPYFQAYLNFESEHPEFKSLFQERRFFCSGYCGTIDDISDLGDGVIAIIDEKTTTKIKPEHHVQVAAYVKGVMQGKYGDNLNLTFLEYIKKMSGIDVLQVRGFIRQLKADETYVLQEVDLSESIPKWEQIFDKFTGVKDCDVKQVMKSQIELTDTLANRLAWIKRKKDQLTSIEKKIREKTVKFLDGKSGSKILDSGLRVQYAWIERDSVSVSYDSDKIIELVNELDDDSELKLEMLSIIEKAKEIKETCGGNYTLTVKPVKQSKCDKLEEKKERKPRKPKEVKPLEVEQKIDEVNQEPEKQIVEADQTNTVIENIKIDIVVRDSSNLETIDVHYAVDEPEKQIEVEKDCNLETDITVSKFSMPNFIQPASEAKETEIIPETETKTETDKELESIGFVKVDEKPMVESEKQADAPVMSRRVHKPIVVETKIQAGFYDVNRNVIDKQLEDEFFEIANKIVVGGALRWHDEVDGIQIFVGYKLKPEIIQSLGKNLNEFNQEELAIWNINQYPIIQQKADARAAIRTDQEIQNVVKEDLIKALFQVLSDVGFKFKPELNVMAAAQSMMGKPETFTINQLTREEILTLTAHFGKMLNKTTTAQTTLF